MFIQKDHFTPGRHVTNFPLKLLFKGIAQVKIALVLLFATFFKACMHLLSILMQRKRRHTFLIRLMVLRHLELVGRVCYHT